jgi:hypothetical protein
LTVAALRGALLIGRKWQLLATRRLISGLKPLPILQKLKLESEPISIKPIDEGIVEHKDNFDNKSDDIELLKGGKGSITNQRTKNIVSMNEELRKLKRFYDN